MVARASRTAVRASRRPSGLRKTIADGNSLAHRTTWLRSDFGVVFVDDAFFSGFIQAADGFKHRGLIGLAGFNGCAGIAHGSSGSPAESSVTQTAFFILSIALDL